MARFLVYTSPARGHLYPITATLLELRRRGHEVHVRTLATEVGALRAAGLQAAPLAPAIEDVPLDDWHGATPVEALLGGLRSFGQRVAHEGSDLQRAIVDVAPDFLIVDITTAGAAAVAEASGLPWAQWVPFFQHFEPIPLDAPELTWIPFTLLPAGIEVIDDGRRRAGLEPLAGPSEARRAPLYLYFTAEPFEIPGLDLPPSVRLVGPGLWEPAADVAVEPDGTGEPLVLVTASSEFQRDDGLVATALRGLADERVRVLASSVSHDPRKFEVPANARVERWVPHGPAIRRSACVVCHGGMGITQRALAAGVPVCVVPFGRDQAEVARRVVATSAGTRVDPAELTPDRLRAAVREAMTMRDGAQRVAEGFVRAGGPAAAADAVEGVLARPAPAVSAVVAGIGSTGGAPARAPASGRETGHGRR